MKKMRNTLLTLGALVAALMTVACSDVNNTSAQTQNSANKGITVSGSLSAGADRSATSSLASDTITWAVAAYTLNADGAPNEDSLVEGNVYENNSFEIFLEEEGDYCFTAIGSVVDGEQEMKVLQGKTDNINVTAEGISNLVITASPLTADEVGVNTGKIKLTIYDESSRISNIRVFEDDEDTASLDSTFSTPFTYNNENPSVGFHTYKFCFEDEIGNTLYTCREAVTVFSSLTTDSWIGNAPYFVQNEDGSARFVITEELLKKYDAEVVPSTQTVLYSQYNAGGTTGYSYYLVESEDEEITENKDPTVTTTYSYNSFCFDAKGYFYALDTDASIKSSNTKITDERLSGVGNLSGITVDHATNILYAWYGMQSTFYIYKLPTFISQGNSEDMVTISPNFDSTVFGSDNNGGMCYHDGELLVINNGKAYGFVSGGSPTLTNGKFYELDLTEETPAARLIDINEAIIDKLSGVSESAKIADMLYQDGAVYILVREYDISGSPNYSRGAVIKYDTIFGTTKVLGQTDTEATSDAYLYGYYYSYTNESYAPLYAGSDGTVDTDSRIISKNGYNPVTVYAPLPDDTNALYGPTKFIAIKPKKLVIADDGIIRCPSFLCKTSGLSGRRTQMTDAMTRWRCSSLRCT